MRILKQFCLELVRLFQSRFTWIAILLTTLSPVAGLTVYRPLPSASESGYVTTMQGMYLADPALAGGVLGAVVLAILTVWNMDVLRRNGMETLSHAVVFPMTAALTHLGALLCTSAVAWLITVLAWLPYTIFRLGAVFDAGSYFLMYAVFMYGALPLAILFISAAYQFTRRLDVSLVLFAAFAVLSLTVWSSQWQLCWLNPCVWAISDDFSNDRILRSAAYMRMGWLLALAGLWCVSYLCVRRYGKGLFGSLRHNVRRIYRPVMALMLAGCAVLIYVKQPFLDNSEMELDYDFLYAADYHESVFCKSWSVQVHPKPSSGRLEGTAVYQLLNVSGEEQSIDFRINPGYQVRSARANGEDVPFFMGTREVLNRRGFTVTLPADESIELVIDYGGYPREWNMGGGVVQGDMEISDIYMVLENTNLSPTLYDVVQAGGRLPVTVDITLPGQMIPVPFGEEEAELLAQNPDGTDTWRVEGYGGSVILYAGDYVREDIPVESAGLTVQFYYARKHQPLMESSDAAGAIRKVVEYCTEHIGPLAFHDGGALKLIEERVSDGGYAGNGASLANELDFTAQNMNDEAKGGTPEQVMIHELVHQWWGLGNMFPPEWDDGPWSSEGLTCYTTYRIVKEIYGEETARRAYVEKWQSEYEDYHDNFYVRHPEYFDLLPEQYQAGITGSLRMVRLYSEMPLKLLKAEELVGGEEAMDKILFDLFNREQDWEYPYLTYQDFLDACDLKEEDLNLE